MRLLVVMANYPFPARTGSAIVAYNCMQLLSRRHHIELVCFQPMDKFDEPLECIDRIELIIKNKLSVFAKWGRYFSHMLIGEPPSVSAYASCDLQNKVREVIQGGKFDAILLFEMSVIQFCPSASFHKLVVNIEDPQSIRLYRMGELPILSLWTKAKLFTLAKITSLYEKRVLHKVEKVFLLSEADMHDMQKQGGYTNLAYMSYGVDQRVAAEIVDYENRENAIVFSGNMYHPPNVDGALFFLKDIFPLILRESPAAVLWIVGADPDARIYEAAAVFGKQVVITGRVDDVAGYIKRAAVSVCPVRLKIGVQTKILEALSWGTPVVTTSAGNSGVGGASGTHLWIEDETNLFAEKVCDLLQGQDWKKMSVNGRLLVAERFTWEDSVGQLERHLEALVATC